MDWELGVGGCKLVYIFNTNDPLSIAGQLQKYRAVERKSEVQQKT